MQSVARSANMARVDVRTPEGAYSIVLGNGASSQIGALASELGLGRRVGVATDSTVGPLYSAEVATHLRASGFEASVVVMPAGEANKSLASVELFVEGFLDAGLDRGGWVLALGGGVVGDTAGFAASIYMRGVALVQVPTTLLAMADSSVGGKVGVDIPRGKNLLGAFKQPALVAADTRMLGTLPPQQISNGMAEVIKAAIIDDAALFERLERAAREEFDLAAGVRDAIEVKRRIVEADPYEAGQRALLNLGHTFGHAFERCSGYARLHGFAVAQGIVVAATLAKMLGMCEESLHERITSVLEKWGLPVRWGGDDLSGPEAVQRVTDAMQTDKKKRDGQLRFVLPTAIGSVEQVGGVELAAVREALEACQ